MIVDSMSFSEIIDMFQKDWTEQIWTVLNHEMRSNKYRRSILKFPSQLKKRHFFKPVFYTSSRKLNYIFLVSTTGKQYFKKKGLSYLVLMYYRKYGKTFVMMPNGGNLAPEGKQTYNFYNPHLFDRYKERELKNNSLDTLNTIISFFENNSIGVIKLTNNPNYENSIFSVTENGILLGSIYGNITELKTYISFKMLKGCQITDKKFMSELIDKYIKQDFKLSDNSIPGIGEEVIKIM